MISDDRRRRGLRRARNYALLGVLVLWAVALVGGAFDLAAFFRAYLYGWLLGMGVSLGAFVFLCVHHLVHGRWGATIRPILERATRVLPLFCLLGVPLALGLAFIYPWVDPAYMLALPLRAAKLAYLEPTFFLARAAVVLLLWSALAWWVARTPPALLGPGRAALSLVVYFITVTVAAVDWILSVDPNMSTSAFGLHWATGNAVAGIAVVAVVAAIARARHGDALPVERLHEVGNLALASVMLWAYIAFAQYLLIWAGDLPRQSAWYVLRFQGPWVAVSWALVVLHFALPFLCLLFRAVKRRPRRLAAVAVLLLLMRPVELAWMLMPARWLLPGAAIVHWLDLVLPLAFGALWLAAFFTVAAASPRPRLLTPPTKEPVHV